MNKRLLAAALCVVLMFMLLPAGVMAGGADVLEISTPEELLAFAEDVNSGSYNGLTDAVVELTADIDMSGYDWVPMGDMDNCWFSGTFEGNGHTVSNLSITEGAVDTYGSYYGFFGHTWDAVIRNVNVSGSIEGDDSYNVCAGAVVGLLEGGEIVNCSTSGFTIDFNNTYSYNTGGGIGGIVGFAYDAEVSDCVSYAQIVNAAAMTIGGVTGQARTAVLENCSFHGSIEFDNCTRTVYAGGIVGSTSVLAGGTATKVINCTNYGSVEAISDYSSYYIDAGGIVGNAQQGAEITNCVNYGAVDASQYNSINSATGGIVGRVQSFAKINYCANYGEVFGGQSSTGGVVGVLSTQGSGGATFYTDPHYALNNCLNAGKVQSATDNVYTGGLIGQAVNISETSTTAYVSNCISVGSVSAAESSKEHPIAAKSKNFTYENNYYDNSQPVNVDDETAKQVNGGSKGVSADYMKTEAFIDEVNAGGGDYHLADNGEIGLGPKFYEVTLVYGNGAADGVFSIEEETEFPLPEAPTNSGYIFLGWRSGDTTYKAGDKVYITTDTTFVAVWGNLPDVKPSEPETPDTPVFPFYDVTVRDWYYSAVKYVYEKGLMDGVDVGVFAPNDTLTRAMVWTIIARAEGVDTTGGATWYAKAQEWVTAKGISDGENPNAAITRQELVTMLYRLAGEPAVSGTITAPDAASVSTWATNAMTWAMNIGLVEGDENGAVTPTAIATRAQAAALIMRYLEA